MTTIVNVTRMAGRLQKEIRQRKPFVSLEEETYLNLVRTADALSRELELVLQPHGITGTQYNVLRILRGAGAEGSTCSGISERLLAYDPDVTRLLDRLEKTSLVQRQRSTTDRRVVMTTITPAGLELLAKLDGPIESQLRRQFEKISRERLRQLIADLEEIRSR
ncbi:MAG TPA: MarR family transcriptional regulator [Thermoanaerobaculia bacterium]|nr:MarR family transcriptional regulator [Thermoanaerobaculia bacterium]